MVETLKQGPSCTARNETCPTGLVTNEAGVCTSGIESRYRDSRGLPVNETCPMGLVTNEPGVFTSVL
jgi:hypothetical protein